MGRGRNRLEEMGMLWGIPALHLAGACPSRRLLKAQGRRKDGSALQGQGNVTGGQWPREGPAGAGQSAVATAPPRGELSRDVTNETKCESSRPGLPLFPSFTQSSSVPAPFLPVPSRSHRLRSLGRSPATPLLTKAIRGEALLICINDRRRFPGAGRARRQRRLRARWGGRGARSGPAHPRARPPEAPPRPKVGAVFRFMPLYGDARGAPRTARTI